MAYMSGTASDQFELLGVIKTILSDNGWTINLYTSDDTSYSTAYPEHASSAKRLHATNGVQYLNFRSTTGCAITPKYYPRTGIGFGMSTGFNSSVNWDQQPGCPRTNGVSTNYPLIAAIDFDTTVSYKIFLFDDPFTLFVHLKIDSTKYCQMYLGTMSNKYGAWTGGDLFLGSSRANSSQFGTFNYTYSFLSNDGLKGGLYITDEGIVLSGNPWPMAGGSYDALILPIVGKCESVIADDYTQTGTGNAVNHLNGMLLQAMPSAFTAPNVLLPIQPAILRDGTTKYSILGELSHMKLTTAAIADMESVITFGGQEYIILPICAPSNENINPCVAVEYEGA